MAEVKDVKVESKFDNKAAVAAAKENPYDDNNLSLLEDFVTFQVKSGEYDRDSNRQVLKLYMFNPDAIKIHVLGNVLLKAMMNLPETDYLASVKLVPPKVYEMEPVKSILRLGNMLESGQFKKFWKEVAAQKNLLAPVAGFEDAMRKFISSVLASTFQVIQLSLLKDLLNLSDKNAIEDFIKTAGWQKNEEDKTVKLPVSRENKMPISSNVEKISLDQVSEILKTFV